jgi:HK97 family phage major capsid protein
VGFWQVSHSHLGLFVEGVNMENKISVIAIKTGDGELVLEVLGAPFGSPFKDGKDSQGDYFDVETKIHQEDYPEIPAIYTHGFDPRTRKPMDRPEIIGKAKYARQDESGHWYTVTLNKANSFAQRIWQAALKGLAKASSGAINYLVRRNEDGRLLEWGIAELTLIDTSEGIDPANPYAIAIPMLKLDYELAGMKINLTAEQENAGDALTQAETEKNNNQQKDTGMTKEEQEAADLKAAQEAEQAKKTAEANKNKPSVEESIFEKMQNEMKAARERKEAEEKHQADIEAKMKEVVAEAMKSAPAQKGGGSAYINSKTQRGDDEKKAFNYYLRTGDRKAYKTLVIMNEGDDESGGAAVPTDFYNQIVMLRDPQSIVRQAGARVIQTSLKTINIPTYATRFTAPAATNESAAATAVSRTINEVEPLDTVAVSVTNYTFLLRLSEELVNDSKFNIEAFISEAVANNYAVLENGLLVTELAATITNKVDAADDVTVALGDIFNVYYDIDSPYRDGASWVMKGSTEGAIRQLVTSSAFAFGVTPQGATGQIGQQWLVGPGNRVFNAATMPALGASNKPIFFGNFKHFALVENGGLTIRRLNERYADTGEIGFVSSLRLGMKVLHGGEAWTYLQNLSS